MGNTVCIRKIAGVWRHGDGGGCSWWNSHSYCYKTYTWLAWWPWRKMDLFLSCQMDRNHLLGQYEHVFVLQGWKVNRRVRWLARVITQETRRSFRKIRNPRALWWHLEIQSCCALHKSHRIVTHCQGKARCLSQRSWESFPLGLVILFFIYSGE